MRINPYERAGRLEKAAKLEQALRLGKITAEEASRMQPEHWALTAKALRMDKPPSEETRRAVIDSMRRFEAMQSDFSSVRMFPR